MPRNHNCLLCFSTVDFRGVGEGSVWYLCQVPTQLLTQRGLDGKQDLEGWGALTRGSDITSSGGC